MECATCNRQATNLGIFEGIRLTLVCTVCAAASVSDAGEPIVCFSSTRTLFPGIPPKRVKALESTPRRNPHYKNAAPMRMYSVAELRVVQEILDQESRIKTAHIEQKRQLRLERMVTVHKISPAAPIHRSLFCPIFGDYLRAPEPQEEIGGTEIQVRGSRPSGAAVCPRPRCGHELLGKEAGISNRNLRSAQKRV